ncbi:MAG: hypothetical protein ABIP51_01710 [Bacteroidia bacterium]
MSVQEFELLVKTIYGQQYFFETDMGLENLPSSIENAFLKFEITWGVNNDETKIKKFMNGDYTTNLTATLLHDLYLRGELEEGDYFISL